MTDWDQRQLCSDGACVGVIGPDGICKVCGRAAANWGDERTRGLVEEVEQVEPSRSEELEPEAASSPDWLERKLCTDGGCVGVIGDDGKCKVCGKAPA